MKRAQQLTGTEKHKENGALLFHTFSDLNVFRILRLQDRLRAMHEHLRTAEENIEWTQGDDADLEKCMRNYCKRVSQHSQANDR
jgi:hypothetical protein